MNRRQALKGITIALAGTSAIAQASDNDGYVFYKKEILENGKEAQIFQKKEIIYSNFSDEKNRITILSSKSFEPFAIDGPVRMNKRYMITSEGTKYHFPDIVDGDQTLEGYWYEAEPHPRVWPIKPIRGFFKIGSK